jgi:Molecular chaperone
VAWATVEDFERDEINIISNWPEHAREEPKAPTELLYENGKVMWGYGIPHDGDPVRWFKLLLLRDEDMTEEQHQSEPLLRARKLMRETGKTATDLVADYLRLLWQHTMETIHMFRSKSVISALTFHVVITVPAIWKDYARKAMEEAARNAGILQARPIGPTTLTFVPEPEAAALVTLCERGREHDIETDDVYVICDAGGGTVVRWWMLKPTGAKLDISC